MLVPYYSAVEKECDDGLRALGQAGIQVRRASFSAIDLLRSVMLSQALRDGFDSFLFIDADIGFNPPDALKLLARPEPVVAGIYMKKNSRDYSGAFAAGVNQVVFGPAAPGLYPMLYASTGFLRIRAEILHRMIDELKMPLCHWGSVTGIYPFFLPLVRARWTRRHSLPDRGLQLLPSPPADRRHPAGGHDDQAVPLRAIRIQL